MEEIKAGLVELLRKAVQFRGRDDYVPPKDLAVLVDVWDKLGGHVEDGPQEIKVMFESPEMERWGE